MHWGINNNWWYSVGLSADMGLSCFIGFVWPFDICIPQKQPLTLHVALGIGCTSQYVCSLCLLVYHFLTWLKAG